MRVNASMLALLCIVSVSVCWSQAALGPVLDTSSPYSGELVNNRSQTITLDFSQPVTAAGVTLTSALGVAVPGTIALAGDQSILVFTPLQPLADSTYTVNFQAVRGVTGYPVEGATSFTFIVDATAPRLISSTPSSGQTGVPVDTQITLRFSEIMDVDMVMSGTSLSASGAPIPLTFVSYNQATNTAVFQPGTDLEFSTTYTVDYSLATDIALNMAAAPATFTFTTAAPPILTLESVVPSDGQDGVLASQPIVFTFSNAINAGSSSITVRSGSFTSSGTLSAVSGLVTFSPAGSYRQGALYTVDFSGVRDIYGQAPTGVTRFTFTTETGELFGSVDPQMVTLSANERAGVTYLISNQTSEQVTLRSSTAQYFVDESLVATVSVPAELTIPANSVGTLISDASISEQIQNAARDAGTDQIIMLRTFTGVPPSAVSVSVPLVIRVGGSLAGPASVTEVILDVPVDSKTVGQFEEIRGHAFIRGTGTGAVVGTWFVDDQPVETFQKNITAGITEEVFTRMSLPTVNLGEHEVELRIQRPQPVDSGPRRYVVIPANVGTQRVHIVSPANRTPLLADAVRTLFGWAPMPGASAYEIAFARSADALGLDESGNSLPGPLGKMKWTQTMEASGQLLLLAKVPSDVVRWSPSPEQYDRLFGGAPGLDYWAVRAVYPAEGTGDPTTTSKPRSVMLQAKPAELALISPADGATVESASPTFEWAAGPEGSTYEFALISDGRTVFTSMTGRPAYTLSELSPFKLTPGLYEWRVSAIRPAEGVVAASGRRSFTVPAVSGAAPVVGRSEHANAVGTAVLMTASGALIPLPGATSLVVIDPANGSVVANQQPTITATFPEAKGALITLNGVDVTGLATVTPTNLTLQPPGMFSEGDHTIVVVVETASGERLQETSRFTIALQSVATAEAAVPGAPTAQQPPTEQPLELDFNWNWGVSDESTNANDLNVDLNLRGQQTWVWRSDSYAAFNVQISRPRGQKFDLSNFLAEAALTNGRHKFLAGDIGSTESDLTAQGLTYRAFNFVSYTGPVRLSAAHTLGRMIQRSSIGRAPDMLLVTAETAKATPEKGLKLTYVNSESDLSASSSFAGPTQSRVISLSGRSLLGKTGLKLRGEVANSDATIVTPFGSQDSSGNAVTATVNGTLAGFNMSTSYRMVDSTYTSPASSTLTNDLNGWVFGLNRAVGKYFTSALSYTTYDNVGNSSTPASSLVSRVLDLTAAYPRWPSFTLRLARNDGASDPFVSDGRPGDTRESTWSLTSNYLARRWNGYLTYSNSDFDDYFDFIDPTIDTPNDRNSGTWSLGFAAHPSQPLKLRVDWGANNVDRWFRTLYGGLPLAGTDGSHQGRLQAEYLISQRLSTTMVWARSNYADALGTYRNDLRDFNARLNYFLKLAPGGGGLVLTAEYRKFSFGGTAPSGSKDVFSILINDNRLLSF